MKNFIQIKNSIIKKETRNTWNIDIIYQEQRGMDLLPTPSFVCMVFMTFRFGKIQSGDNVLIEQRVTHAKGQTCSLMNAGWYLHMYVVIVGYSIYLCCNESIWGKRRRRRDDILGMTNRKGNVLNLLIDIPPTLSPLHLYEYVVKMHSIGAMTINIASRFSTVSPFTSITLRTWNKHASERTN